MKTATIATQVKEPLNLETIRIRQLTKKLSELVKINLHIIDKTRSLSSILKGPAFNQIISSSSECTEGISEALIHYNRYIYSLEYQAALLTDVSIIDDHSYSGWVERVKELIASHTKAKDQIMVLFSQYDEMENRELFSFLRKQMDFHKNQIHQLRNCIEG